MRLSNTKEFSDTVAKILIKERDFLNRIFVKGYPKKYYHVDNSGSICEILVSSIRILRYINNQRISIDIKPNKVPTKNHILQLRKYLETQWLKENIYFIPVSNRTFPYEFFPYRKNSENYVLNKKSALIKSKKILENIKHKNISSALTKDDLKTLNYTSLGDSNSWNKHPIAYTDCIKKKHKLISISTLYRGIEIINVCPICKIYWKYDSTD